MIILLAIVFAVSGRKKNSSPFVSTVLNAFSVAFLANAYFVKSNLTISITNLMYIFLSCVALYIIYIIFLYIPWILKKAGWFLLFISIISIITIIVLWITGDNAFFSNLLFSLIITIAMLVCAISEEVGKNAINKNIIILSFSSLIVLVVVLSLLLESGDFFEGIGSGTSGGKNHRKAPQNIEL